MMAVVNTPDKRPAENIWGKLQNQNHVLTNPTEQTTNRCLYTIPVLAIRQSRGLQLFANAKA